MARAAATAKQKEDVARLFHEAGLDSEQIAEIWSHAGEHAELFHAATERVIKLVNIHLMFVRLRWNADGCASFIREYTGRNQSLWAVETADATKMFRKLTVLLGEDIHAKKQAERVAVPTTPKGRYLVAAIHATDVILATDDQKRALDEGGRYGGGIRFVFDNGSLCALYVDSKRFEVSEVELRY